ncbi:MAG TPA: expansin EXLX1 family cellulose-binding protein [Polyangiaceae bacterium]
MKWARLGQLGAVLVLSAAPLGCSSSNAKSGGATDTTPPATNVITTENFGIEHTGDGTFYTFADGTGACLYDKTTDIHIAALNVGDWDNSAWCGACADVTGPDNKMVRVRIVDECPDCAPGQLDMHPDAFAELAPKSEGRIAITWTFVACDAVGPVTYKYKDGSNAFWTAVQVRNSRYPISKLESSKDGASWTEAQRQDYDYFLNGGGFGAGSTQVRITAVNGDTLIDSLPAVQASLEVSGQSQFPAATQ